MWDGFWEDPHSWIGVEQAPGVNTARTEDSGVSRDKDILKINECDFLLRNRLEKSLMLV